MLKFADEVVLTVQSGNGGSGAVSFRREKNEPLGGPDGGIGGIGGNVYFLTRQNLKTLTHINQFKTYKAQDGQKGGTSNKTGADGEDIIIPIPPGTLVKNSKGEVLLDAVETDKEYLFLSGGEGGLGNSCFKTSVNQVPYKFQPGKPGVSQEIKLELNLIADIGFVGFPNAGKSSLLVSLTKAKSEIAPYPFTTKIPHLGVLYIDQDRTIVLADIPGLLEGASKGIGLGDKFLKHILRTQTLAYMIDITGGDYYNVYKTLENELLSFSDKFKDKKKLIIGTKLDISPEKENEFIDEFVNNGIDRESVIVISSYSNMNLKELIKKFENLCYFKTSDW